MELGPEACWLLTVVAFTEDARRYRGPVTFWNHQLTALVGCSLNRLMRIRAKVVAAGWLHYSPGAKGKAARYHVTIPPECDFIPDGAADEGGFTSILEVQTGTQTEVQTTATEDSLPIPTRIQFQNGTANVNKPEVQTSNILPIPNPNPIAVPKAASQRARKGKAAFVPPTLDEVKAEARQQGYKCDPEKFWNHYRAIDWRKGRNRIVNWQAALAKWESDEGSFSDGKKQRTATNRSGAGQSYDPAVAVGDGF